MVLSSLDYLPLGVPQDLSVASSDLFWWFSPEISLLTRF